MSDGTAMISVTATESSAKAVVAQAIPAKTIPARAAAATAILAIDLGKFKSVACRYDPASGVHAFETIATTPSAVHDLLVASSPSVLVMEQSWRCVTEQASTSNSSAKTEPAEWLSTYVIFSVVHAGWSDVTLP